ncbi:universal stress protein [Rhizobium tumorigenes]|uniref:universal stress protein n=1 Tax=Rhizobium tumorigenes TaxID=2041385 RepID=UPI00241DD138|nr:universal stress protein [Rhizobium tumorigenes]WFS02151.1 universal stress protein [Rhizobium tumorigenes]
MAFRTIVTILDVPQNAGIASDIAFSLAAGNNSHVIGLHAEIVSPVPMVAPMEIPDPIAVQALQDMARSEAATIEQLFHAKATASGGSFEWRSFASSAGYDSQPIIETARSADLIVAVQPDPANPSDGHVDVESFLFESGRPVLMVPYILKAPNPIRRVLIAWNGSKEAARATFDAMLFLKAADSVEILSIDPAENRSNAPATGADISAALVRRGIKATLTTTESADKSASQIIEKRLAEDSIDLLVMGAYTQSRLWEMLFGGATKTMLKSMTALTLLSR